MKKYNLYTKLKPKYLQAMREQENNAPSLTELVTDILINTKDIQDLTLHEMSIFLLLTSRVKDRYDLNYMEIFYGGTHFYTDAEIQTQIDDLPK